MTERPLLSDHGTPLHNAHAKRSRLMAICELLGQVDDDIAEGSAISLEGAILLVDAQDQLQELREDIYAETQHHRIEFEKRLSEIE